jgi:hypothetical protein
MPGLPLAARGKKQHPPLKIAFFRLETAFFSSSIRIASREAFPDW